MLFVIYNISTNTFVRETNEAPNLLTLPEHLDFTDSETWKTWKQEGLVN